MYYVQEKILFYPQPVDPVNKRKLKDFEVSVPSDRVLLMGWFVPSFDSNKKTLIIYFDGNAGEVSWHGTFPEKYNGASLLLINYRGYGESMGSPGEENLFADALKIYDYAQRELKKYFNHVILIGRSLGSGVACYLAKHRPVKAMVLITPYDSVLNVTKHYFPFIFTSLILKHRFESIKLSPSIQCSTLVFIAENDRIIPRKSSMNLINNWGGNIEYHIIKGTDHNNILSTKEYWDIQKSFLERIK